MNFIGRPKLFIVEDNFMYSYALENMLKDKENFKITSFTSCETCIELLDNNPQAIILDYNLEGSMTGLDTFRIIHGKKPHIPVIILSGQADTLVASDLLKAGAFDYIEKKEPKLTLEKLRTSVLKALSLS